MTNERLMTEVNLNALLTCLWSRIGYFSGNEYNRLATWISSQSILPVSKCSIKLCDKSRMSTRHYVHKM